MSYGERHIDTETAARFARHLLQDVLEITPGEAVLITNDPEGSTALAELLVEQLTYLGAQPNYLLIPRREHPGAEIPPTVAAAAAHVSVWIEVNYMYMEGSQQHIQAQENGLRRFYSLTGMDASDLVTMFDVDLALLHEFGDRLAEVSAGEQVTIQGNGSTFTADVTSVENDTMLMPPGQVHIYPKAGSYAGSLVFDGYAFPPRSVGVLETPVTARASSRSQMEIEAGNAAASEIHQWITRTDAEELARLCHISYGFHPRVRRSFGSLVRDERIFGGLCVGLGAQMPYRSHIDFGMLFPTVLVDGRSILKDGRFVDKVLVDLAHNLEAPGY